MEKLNEIINKEEKTVSPVAKYLAEAKREEQDYLNYFF